jgi:hypothetical protein
MANGPFTSVPGYGYTVTAEVDGFMLAARIEYDDCGDTPWERGDGHGPVSEWTSRGKRPGEWVLCQDRGSRRYYDAQAAVRQAKEEGWDAPPYGVGTTGERATRAVKADFERLRAWCNDEWSYVGVVVSVSRNGVVLDEHAASLWGIESDAGDYLREVANELADEALDAGRVALARVCAA